jgi:uncharacterized membrane protein HdeD (DUF308 family)
MLAEDEAYIERDAAKHWWLFLLAGIAWIFISWLVLRMNITSLATVGVLIGVLFILAAFHEMMIAGIRGGGGKVWHYILAAIFFLGSLWAFIRPINTFFALVSVLGLVLILYGTMDIISSIATRAVNPYWWIGLITGILLVLLAFWVSGSNRVYNLNSRTYLILFFVGFFALFRGISQIVLAFTIRHAGKEAGRALAT